MTPTARAAGVLGVLALSALVLPGVVVMAAVGLLVLATAADGVAARRPPRLRRSMSLVLSRAVPSRIVVESGERSESAGGRNRVRVRQPAAPDLSVEPREGDGRLEAIVVARRRGRHALPAVAAERRGPLGLATREFEGEGRSEVLVFPDVPAARRLALAVRRGRFREQGRQRRGPLGLGTEFESIRDYLPDDDIRQVNWTATARVGRPMSNQYRIEQDRDVVCLVDAGRLMGAPIGDLTRLDATVDAATAVVLVADEMGDRSGVIAFDAELRRQVEPRRHGGDAVVRAIFDLEPRALDSDYDLAFRSVGGSKRSLVLVLTDLLDEAAARSLVAAVPVLARRHAVVVASVRDPDVDAAALTKPNSVSDVCAAVVALDLLDARARVVVRLRAAGAEVVEAAPARLGEACVGVYLRLKERARI